MSWLHLHALAESLSPLLGPSLFVWVQGCPRRCPGCFNSGALDTAAPAPRCPPSVVAERWARTRGGLVLSGGEPFLQAGALADLCRLVRRVAPTTPVLTYTGFLLEELREAGNAEWRKLLDQTDVLVDGPYRREVPSTNALLGSGNQRLFRLTDRVPESSIEHLPAVHVEAVVEPSGGVRLVGTGNVDLQQVLAELRAQGLEVED